MKTRRRTALLAAALASAVVWAYSNALEGPFVFDDAHSVAENPSIRIDDLSWTSLSRAAREGAYARRPVANVTFAANFLAGGLDPVGYHATNVAIHVGSAFALVAFLTLLVPREDPRRNWFPWTAGFLWALHPIQTQAVTYVTQRMTSLAGFFYFAGLAAYLSARRASRGLQKAGAFAAAAILLALGLGTKEIVAIFPFTILAIEFWMPPAPDRKGGRKTAFAVAGLGLALLAALVALVPGLAGDLVPSAHSLLFGGPVSGRPFTTIERLWTESRVIVRYASLLAIPLPSLQNVDPHVDPISRSPFDPLETAACLVFVGLAAVVAVRFRRRAPLASLFVAWFLLHLAIESTVVGLELMFEHRLYLPSVGAAGLAALALERIARGNARARSLLAVALAATLGVATRERNEVWRTRLELFADCAAKSPRKLRPLRNYAAALAHEGRIDEAIATYRRAVGVAPRDPDRPHTLADLGFALVQAGRGREAREAFLEATHRGSYRADTHYGLGLAAWMTGDRDEARTAFREAIRLDGFHRESRFRLGMLLLEVGRAREGVDELARACQVAPGDDELRRNLLELGLSRGRTWIDETRTADAILVLELVVRETSALDHDPSWINASLFLGVAHEHLHAWDSALAVYEGALARGIEVPELHRRIACLADGPLPDPAKRRRHARRVLVLEPSHPEREVLLEWAKSP